MKKLFLLIALLSVAACGKAEWVKKGASQADTKKAYEECRYEAIKASASCSLDYRCVSKRDEVGVACMNLRGYKLAGPDYRVQF